MIPRPSVTPQTSWSFPRPEITQLANGMDVWAYHLPGQFILSCDLVMELPMTAEPRDREGLATITARCLDEGTSAHPGSSFAQALERVGAQFEGSAGLSTTQGLLDVPSDSFDDALPLLAEALIAPANEPSDVARVVANRLAEIEQRQSRGSYIASRALRQALVNSDQRASRAVGGDAETVTGITNDDVRWFHDTHYQPSGATFVIGGDLSDVNYHDCLSRVLGDWSPTTEPMSGEKVAPGAGARRMIHRDGAVQADIRLGWFGIDQHDPRWPHLQVALSIMGGTFSSRLNQALREDRGYTYGVSMGASAYRFGGTIELATSTRTDVARDAIDQAMEIIAAPQPFTDQEVDRAIDYLTYSAPLSYDTAEAIATQGANLVAGGLPWDHITQTLLAFRTVTPDSAMDAYRGLVDTNQASVIVVGDGTELGDMGFGQA